MLFLHPFSHLAVRLKKLNLFFLLLLMFAGAHHDDDDD